MRWLLLFIMLFTYCRISFAQATPVPEAEVKAVFLFHFTSFVDWPSGAFANPQEPFVIGILGKNPFGTYLEDAIRGEKKGGQPLTIKYYGSASEVQACHILFITKMPEEEQVDALATLKGRSILTVGDTPYFTAIGGMIKFYIENNKVKLQINMEAVKNAKLMISSKLLSVATIVNSPEP